MGQFFPYVFLDLISFEKYLVSEASSLLESCVFKKVISLASVRISHTLLGTPIINPERSAVAIVTKISVFIFGVCEFHADLAYSICSSPSVLT